MQKRTHALLMLAAVVVTTPGAAIAQDAKAGEQIYKEVCFACHATGLEKAPKFGDRAMWAPLIKEGQAKLTADGWLGERGMPAKGGRAGLTLEEFSRAVAYMARAGGANWKDPDAAMLARIREQEKLRRESRKAGK